MGEVAAVRTPRVPAWFRAALTAPVGTRRTRVAGSELAVRSWGDAEAPGVILVHGVAAHAGWWDHIGPQVAAAGLRVTAMDLSGHGDSGRRDRYSISTWADEVAAVRVQAASGRDPAVVGHSLGGLVALELAARPTAPPEVVALDSAALPADPRRDAARSRIAARLPTVHETASAAVARFRPHPDQHCLEYVREHVARTGLERVPGGWSWKVDPRVFDRPTLGLADLAPARCPVTLVRSGAGRLTPEGVAAMRARLGPAAAAEIPGAGHHPMLDRPLELIGVLCGLLGAARTSRSTTS